MTGLPISSVALLSLPPPIIAAPVPKLFWAEVTGVPSRLSLAENRL